MFSCKKWILHVIKSMLNKFETILITRRTSSLFLLLHFIRLFKTDPPPKKNPTNLCPSVVSFSLTPLSVLRPIFESQPERTTEIPLYNFIFNLHSGCNFVSSDRHRVQSRVECTRDFLNSNFFGPLGI